MKSTKILIGLAVVTIFCVTYSQSIGCSLCTDMESCKKPTKLTCTQSLANETTTYLDAYHNNVPTTTNSTFECFSEYHKSLNGEFYRKGCVYSHIRVCNLEMKVFYTQNLKRTCGQCNNKDYCNPAGRAELSVGLPIVAIILAVLGKYF